MRKINLSWLKALAYSFILILAFQSCRTTTAKQQASPLLKVHQGQTKEEVFQLLGNPTARRFNELQEEWEYQSWHSEKAYKVVVVTFFENRVLKLDTSYKPIGAIKTKEQELRTVPRNIQKEVVPKTRTREVAARQLRHKEVISKEELERIIEQDLKHCFRASDGFRVLRIRSKNYLFTCLQVRKLLHQFIFTSDKIKALRILAPRITDNENDRILIEEFTFPEKDEAMKILGYGY